MPWHNGPTLGFRMLSFREAPVFSSRLCTYSSAEVMVRPKGSGNSTAPHLQPSHQHD